MTCLEILNSKKVFTPQVLKFLRKILLKKYIYLCRFSKIVVNDLNFFLFGFNLGF